MSRDELDAWFAQADDVLDNWHGSGDAMHARVPAADEPELPPRADSYYEQAIRSPGGMMTTFLAEADPMSTTCDACGGRTDGFLCTGCGADLKRTILAFPGLMHDLSILATGQARVYRRNGRPVPMADIERWDVEQARIPARLRSTQARTTLVSTRTMVNLAARDKLDETWNALTTWARLLVESRGSEQEMPTPLTATALATWLADRINSVRYDEAGPQMHAELTKLRGQLVHLVDRAPSRVYAGPCHEPLAEGQRCERGLYAAFNPWAKRDERGPEDRVIVCDGFRPPNLRVDDPEPIGYGCGAEHAPSDRVDWLLAELADRLEPLDFWQDWGPKLRPDLVWPNRTTWVRWVQRDALMSKSLTFELFRGGDVIDLVEREQPRILGNTGRARRTRDALLSRG